MYCRIINANIQNCRITNSTRRDAFTDYSHGNGITSNFTYNYNGSLTFDPAKQANYAYNILGMPKTVTVPNINGTITYKYSAAGEKLSVDYKWHNGLSLDPLENIGLNYQGTNSSKTVEYIGNKIYENGNLKQILLPNGYYSNGYYYFYLRDHLGNNCVVAHSSGGIAQSTYYHPYGKPIGNGESWGQSTQPHKYNGMEEETMMGLTQYDLINRTLDYSYNSFNTLDRFCEKFPWQSPYIHAAGNPIRYVDVRGDSVWISYEDANNQQQRILYTQGMTYEGDNEFVSDVVTSLNHLAETGAMMIDFGDGNKVDVLGTLVSSDVNIKIQAGKEDNYTNRTKTISFSNEGIEFTKYMGGTDKGQNSPSAVLGHELVHAYRHNFARESYLKNQNTTYSNHIKGFFDKEDLLTTTNWANQINTALRQDTRSHYHIKSYKTISPTSTVKKP